MNLKKLSLLLAAILTVAALSCSCTSLSDVSGSPAVSANSGADGEESALESGIWASAVYTSDVSVGEGGTVFTLKITAGDRTITVTVSTDEAVLGDALVAAGLIAGEEGDYGLYVKTVNGMTLDYDTDGMYWAFYIDGEYAMTGVDGENIDFAKVYELKAE